MSRVRGRCLACLGVLLLAAEAPAQVVWHGAECGPLAAARVQDARAPRVDVDIVEQAAGWVATLTARYPDGGTGTRRIQAASCAQLQRAIAVSLSLLDPSVAPPRETSSVKATDAAAPAAVIPTAPSMSSASVSVALGRSAAAPSGASVVLTQPVMPDDDATNTPSAPTPPADTGAGAEIGPRSAGARAGFVRAVALVGSAGGKFAEVGAALAGSLWLGPWGGRIELSARRPFSPVSAEHDFSLELQRFAAALELCTRRLGAIEWGLCGGPRLELVAGLSSGPTDPARDAVWLPGVGAGTWLRLPIAPQWALSSELQGSWSLRRAEVNVAPWGSVYELPRLGAALLVGAELEL